MTWLIAAWLMATPSHAKKVVSYTAVRIDLEGSAGLCPGAYQKLNIYTTDEDGKEKKVKMGKWKSFSLSWDIGAVSKKGVLEMPLDPVVAWGKQGEVTATFSNDETVTASASLPARYDCELTLTRVGEAGTPGPSGERGSSTANSNGGPGQAGASGQEGRSGPDLEVRVHLVKEPVKGIDVLQVAVKDNKTGESWNTAIAAVGGRMTIASAGGGGGGGGVGGEGGTAAPDRDGGNGGHGGNGGQGGSGGNIVVTIDPAAQAAAGALVFQSPGGAEGPAGPGGAGGQAFDPGTPGQQGPDGHVGVPGQPGPATDLRVAPVGPLW